MNTKTSNQQNQAVISGIAFWGFSAALWGLVELAAGWPLVWHMQDARVWLAPLGYGVIGALLGLAWGVIGLCLAQKIELKTFFAAGAMSFMLTLGGGMWCYHYFDLPQLLAKLSHVGLSFFLGLLAVGCLLFGIFYKILALGGPGKIKVRKVIISFVVFTTFISAKTDWKYRVSQIPFKQIKAVAPFDPTAPNIVLITPDSLRADHLSSYGYKNIHTKSIDELAQTGVLFKNVQAAAPWSAPGFASLLTGLPPSLHGLLKDKFTLPSDTPDNLFWLAQGLKDLGYRTQGFTNSHWLDAKYGFSQGFDDYQNLKGGLIFPDEQERHRMLSRYDKEIRLAFLWAFWKSPVKPVRHFHNSTEAITGRAVEWLERHKNTPFFLWLHYLDPYPPFERYKNYHLNPAYNGRLAFNDVSRRVSPKHFKSGHFKLTPADREQVISLYDEEILWVDENVGQIIKKLKDLKLWDKTIIIFSSASGLELWEHEDFGLGNSLHAELLHVPLIIHFPKKFDPGLKVDNLASILDLVPTIFDILGQKPRKDWRGRSLLPLIYGEQEQPRTVFSESLFFNEEQKAIQQGEYKLIYRPQSDLFEMYNTAFDPLESENIAALEPLKSKQLKDKLVFRIQDTKVRSRKDQSKNVSFSSTKEQLKALGYILSEH